MALMLTVTTNVLGVFTVPFILNAVLLSAPGGDSGGADTDMAAAAAKLLLKLVISIIIPMAVGKGTREFVEQAPKLTTKYKTELGLTNNSCLIAIVWMSISKSRGKLVRESALNIFVIVVAGVTLHMFFLAMNWVMTTPVLRLPEAERRAVLLMGKDPKEIDAANAAKRAGGVVEEAESRAENGVSSEARVGVAGDTKA
jgi:sodium/bile acid cotransporter 7